MNNQAQVQVVPPPVVHTIHFSWMTIGLCFGGLLLAAAMIVLLARWLRKEY